MNLSVLSPEILVCEEADWSDVDFQIRFTQQLLNIISLFEKNKDKAQIAITIELLNQLWVNCPWNKDCWTETFFRSKNYGEIYGDLKRVSNFYDDKEETCKINPDIFSVGDQSIREKLIALLHTLLDKSADRTVLVGFNNKTKCDKIMIICKCHKNQTYDVFTIDTYIIYLQNLSKLTYILTPQEKKEIKINFKNWRIKPDKKQNRVLKKYNLLFEHRESGYGRIYSQKYPYKFHRVSCTPSANNAGQNIALNLINLIEEVRSIKD